LALRGAKFSPIEKVGLAEIADLKMQMIKIFYDAQPSQFSHLLTILNG